ncbi:hypothetical protein MUP59_05245 [Candidatus Bathyarchaeota archaeon]|nr:hypothetical protein [Candidatus Bathyarchaeota archaeon]
MSYSDDTNKKIPEGLDSSQLRPYAEFKKWQENLFADQPAMRYNYMAGSSNDFTDADPNVLARFILLPVANTK